VLGDRPFAMKESLKEYLHEMETREKTEAEREAKEKEEREKEAADSTG